MYLINADGSSIGGYSSAGGGGSVEVETTNVANVEYFEATNTINITTTTLSNVQTGYFDYTPVSDSSTLLIEYNFQGQINNTAGTNSTVVWAIGEGGAAISSGISQGHLTHLVVLALKVLNQFAVLFLTQLKRQETSPLWER